MFKECTKGVWLRSLCVHDSNVLFTFETVLVFHVIIHVRHVKIGEVLVRFSLLLTP